MADLDITALRKLLDDYRAGNDGSIDHGEVEFMANADAILDAAEERDAIAEQVRRLVGRFRDGATIQRLDAEVEAIRAQRDALRAQRDGLLAAAEAVFANKDYTEVRPEYEASFAGTDQLVALMAAIRAAKEQP